jgi:putative oxidoreductase
VCAFTPYIRKTVIKCCSPHAFPYIRNTISSPIIFDWGITMNNTLMLWTPRLLSVLRIITGLLLFQYGVAKIFKFPVMPYFANIPPLITVAGALELVLGALLMVGFFTRPVAFILSGLMAAAYFMGHMFKGGTPVFLPLLNNGTPAILFCFTCLYLAAAGSGPWGLDAMMRKK